MLAYDGPYRRKIVSTLKKAEDKQLKLRPEPDYMPMEHTYHRVIGGAYVLPGNDGHYTGAEGVVGFERPIGLPKPVGADRSGGKRKTLIARNLEQIGEYIKPVGKPLVELAQKTIQKKIDKLDGKKGGRMSGGVKSGGKMSGGRSERGKMVSALMKEKGMTLPQASKYIKEHGLM